MDNTRRKTILIANPSPDVYGSDLQMLESIDAFVDAGHRVIVAIPSDGPLVARIRARGGEVMFMDFPVLRRANATAGGVVRLGLEGLRSVSRITRRIRSIRPDAVYVNTVTLPWWLIAAKLARVPAVCHVHEAETTDGRLTRLALNAPLLFASSLIIISNATLEATTNAVPGLTRRSHIIYNGVPQPPYEPRSNPLKKPPFRIAVVARLSPRKAPDVALEAVAIVRGRGLNVELEVAGTPFEGYEWFEEQLRSRADQPDLRGAVTFSGYVSPIWPVLKRSHIVAAPSLREPFGNAVVEAQLSKRPVIASAALGHLETVSDGETGLLVEPGNAAALADAIERLVRDPVLASALAATGRTGAIRRFSVERYRTEVVALIDDLRKPRHMRDR